MDRGPAISAKGTQTRRRTGVAAALACAVALAAAATPARAVVTIGQLPPSAPMPNCPSTGTDYLEPSVTSGNLYIARQAGTITSWSTLAASAGASYVFKVFRRTSDPDVFQVVAHSPPHTLSSGLNTVPVSLAVRSGDMLGLNAGGNPPFESSCTFEAPGDTVLDRTGSLSDGGSGPFSATNNPDSRLNLAAVLVPSNGFTVSVARDRKRGTATVTAIVSNPGTVSLAGKGLKSSRAAKAVFVAGPVVFQVATRGKWRRRLLRTGRVKVGATLTFSPTGGDPSTQQITLRPKKKRTRHAL